MRGRGKYAGHCSRCANRLRKGLPAEQEQVHREWRANLGKLVHAKGERLLFQQITANLDPTNPDDLRAMTWAMEMLEAWQPGSTSLTTPTRKTRHSPRV